MLNIIVLKQKLATSLPIYTALICSMLRADFTNGKQTASTAKEKRLASVPLCQEVGLK